MKFAKFLAVFCKINYSEAAISSGFSCQKIKIVSISRYRSLFNKVYRLMSESGANNQIGVSEREGSQHGSDFSRSRVPPDLPPSYELNANRGYAGTIPASENNNDRSCTADVADLPPSYEAVINENYGNSVGTLRRLHHNVNYSCAAPLVHTYGRRPALSINGTSYEVEIDTESDESAISRGCTFLVIGVLITVGCFFIAFGTEIAENLHKTGAIIEPIFLAMACLFFALGTIWCMVGCLKLALQFQ